MPVVFPGFDKGFESVGAEDLCPFVGIIAGSVGISAKDVVERAEKTVFFKAGEVGGGKALFIPNVKRGEHPKWVVVTMKGEVA